MALIGTAGLKAQDCATGVQDPAGGLQFTVGTLTPTARITNPIPASVAAALATAQAAAPTATVTAGNVRVCWLSESQAVNGTTCSDLTTASRISGVPFTIGVCEMTGTPPKPLVTMAQSGDTLPALATAPVIVFDYLPTVTGQTSSYVRLEWTENVVTPAAGNTPASTVPIARSKLVKLTGSAPAKRWDEDSRYKLWLYTGYSYFRSAHDFKDGYPELRARFETRLIDRRIDELVHCAAKTAKCHPLQLWYTIARIYGEVGLTGIDVEATSSTTTQPANRTHQTFDGSVGVGWGKTLLVTHIRPEDTDAFSIQGLLRLGLTTIPGTEEVRDGDGNVTTREGRRAQAYSYSLGGRTENESGHFQGAYFELGFGQSEKFTLKKVPRLRVDALLPINAPGNYYRLALRVQTDLPRPFASTKGTGDDLGKNLEGEIRVSLLFNIDILEIAKRLGGPSTASR